MSHSLKANIERIVDKARLGHEGTLSATESILKAVRECVPEENVFEYDSKKKLHHRWEGFNACRRAILEKLGE